MGGFYTLPSKYGRGRCVENPIFVDNVQLQEECFSAITWAGYHDVHMLIPPNNTMTRNSVLTGVVRYVRQGCSGSAKHVLHHLITSIFLSLEVSGPFVFICDVIISFAVKGGWDDDGDTWWGLELFF